MIGEAEIQELENIRMETELLEKKKALREAKYAGLRTAMQAVKTMLSVRAELGVQPNLLGTFHYHWKF